MSQMNDQAQETISATEKTVGRLVEECRKNSALYKESPKAGLR